jgi:N-acyl homoserine lactone hydrolase
MRSLKVHPLHVGTITRQVVNFCPGLKEATADLPLICWYIEGPEKKILVDTGGGDPSEASPRWLPYRREGNQSIDSALAKVGQRCEDIDVVIVTHLHWDHTGGNTLFPRAKLIVQEEELRHARSQEASGACLPGIVDLDYTVISGDTEIAEGVKTILTPGHTHGLQGVLVEGATRRIFIASDTLPFFKNFAQKPYAVSNIYVDLEKYHASLKKIAELGAFILPAHDFGVFDKEVYH